MHLTHRKVVRRLWHSSVDHLFSVEAPDALVDLNYEEKNLIRISQC